MGSLEKFQEKVKRDKFMCPNEVVKSKITEPAHTLLYDPKKLMIIKESLVDSNNLYEIINKILPRSFNEKQEEFFHQTFSNRVSLLWGPPGTGKTTVLAGVVLGWLEKYFSESSGKGGLRICIGSSNYNAIDNVLESVLQLLYKTPGYEKIVRLARLRSESAQPPIQGIEDISAGDDLLKESLLTSLVNTTDILILGGTWQQLSKLAQNINNEPNAKWFDLLIIDEASQVQVSAAAAYFLLLKEHAHIVLAGDDKQLGPIYGFEIKDKEKGLYDCIFTYMKETHEIQPVQLSENYRTNQQISEWPGIRFYQNEYMAFHKDRKLSINLSNRVKPDSWPANLPWSDSYWDILNPEFPITVITYPSKTYTVSNDFEAQIVAAISYLYKILVEENEKCEDFWQDKLGLVTPHRAQMSLIKNLIIDNFPVPDLSNTPFFVDTVDRFQGQERDLIISSYVVADKDFIGSEAEFILSARRFNVTLTRARHKFIMIVSQSLIDYLPNDSDIAIEAAHLQLFVQKYCSVVNDELKLSYINNGNHESISCKMRVK